MSVKCLVKIVTGTLLIASFSTSYAMAAKCPSVGTVREMGSKLTYAYQIKDSDETWVLASEPFQQGDDETNWQTLYTVNFSFSGASVDTVLENGQIMFNKSPLLAEPASTVWASGKVECLFTAADANYKVTVVSPAKFGRLKQA